MNGLNNKIYTKGTYEITAEIVEFIAFVKKGSLFYLSVKVYKSSFA